jgi:cytochrome c biogenesis protein
VSFDGLLRFASLDIAYNPGGVWVLVFSMLALFALMASLLIPRRRVWVRQLQDGTIELAALARGDDAKLDDFLDRVKQELEKKMTK